MKKKPARVSTGVAVLASLRVSRERYPNNTTYFVVWLGTERIGSFDAKSCGYVPANCKKPLMTIEAAARDVLFRRVQRLMHDCKRLHAAMELPVLVDVIVAPSPAKETP